MATGVNNPYEAVDLDFTRTRKDTKPIRFLFQDSAGAAIDNTGYTYKMEGDLAPDPTTVDGRQFELTYTGTGDGYAVFSPTAADMNPDDDIVFYCVRQTAGGTNFTPVKGRITFEPTTVDVEV